MRKVATDKAVGKVLAYDTTVVTKDESSTLFRRGHRITNNDVSRLKNSGVYEVWTENGSDESVYEWDISYEICQKICDGTTDVIKGDHGIAFLVSKIPGLVEIDGERLTKFNLNQQVLVITKGKHTAVGRGEIIAAVDVIPLSISRGEMERVSKLASRGMVSVRPFRYSKIGLIITGTEIFEKRKKDQYYRIIKSKCEKYGWTIVYHEIVPDDQELETKAIIRARNSGAEAVIVTSGMSVDPTDKSPSTIKSISARVIAYGIPIKPTTMSIVSIWKGMPLFGISAGGIHYREFNSIDVVFTQMMAGHVPTKREIAKLGIGGIFLNYDPKKLVIHSKK